MISKKEIMLSRDEVRNAALEILRKRVINLLNAWNDKEKQGEKLSGVSTAIPSALDGELPEELRTELADAGYKCEIAEGVLHIS